jgi:hypothetical protein
MDTNLPGGGWIYLYALQSETHCTAWQCVDGLRQSERAIGAPIIFSVVGGPACRSSVSMLRCAMLLSKGCSYIVSHD